MANTIQIKRSTTSGNTPTLSAGELGVNITDEKLWVGNGTSNVLLNPSASIDYLPLTGGELGGDLEFTPANLRGVYFSKTTGSVSYIRGYNSQAAEVDIGSDNKVLFTETDGNTVKAEWHLNSSDFRFGISGTPRETLDIVGNAIFAHNTTTPAAYVADTDLAIFGSHNSTGTLMEVFANNGTSRFKMLGSGASTFTGTITGSNGVSITGSSSFQGADFSSSLSGTGATFSGAVSVGQSAVPQGSNQLEVNGLARVKGSLVVGNAAANQTAGQALHIKGGGTQGLRIEDSTSSNYVYDLTADFTNGFKLIDVTSSVDVLTVAKTTGDATFSGALTGTSAGFSGAVTVGDGGNAVLYVRHIEGKHHENNNSNPLWLNYYNGQAVYIGSNTQTSDLIVRSGGIAVRGAGTTAPGAGLDIDTDGPVSFGGALTGTGATFTGDVEIGAAQAYKFTGSTAAISQSLTNDLNLYASDDINIKTRWARFYNGSTEHARIAINGSWVTGHFYPIANGTQDLGKTDKRWNNIYSEAGNFTGELTTGKVAPLANNAHSSGGANYRWSTVYGVAGNFSGGLTVSGTTNLGGAWTNFGGGYGATGVSISNTGNIQANGTLTVDGALTGTTATFSGAVTWSGGGSANANTAYGWGNHASSTYNYATQSYVGTQIANLVASAPTTLDTLNELAAALGDDANYAATTATAIGLKMPYTGGTFTGAITGTSATFSGSLKAGTGTLTANSQNDVALFSADGTYSQSGNFYNKLKLFGGDGQSRDLQLWQQYNEYAHLGTSWDANQLFIDSDFTDFTVNCATSTFPNTLAVTTNLKAQSFNSHNITADESANITFFGTGDSAQAGAYYSKLKIKGGGGQSRDLQLWQEDSGYSHIGTSWTNNNQLHIDDFAGLYVNTAATFSGTLSSGAITATADTDALFVKSVTNANAAEIAFSSHVASSYAQVGRISYQHGDGSSYGGSDVFTIGSTESAPRVLADGLLMFKSGLAVKPATGTGAGTTLITSGRALQNITTISTSGSVGIGTASPQSLLHLYSTADSFFYRLKQFLGCKQVHCSGGWN